MNIEQKDTYSIVTVNAASEIAVNDIQALVQNTDLVIVLDSSIPFSEELASTLESLTEYTAEQEKALVVVHEDVAMMDAMDDYCVCLPTLSEAHDYIYMEQLERNF